jgi:imidazolonepropionase-like amidohydrolase
MSKKSRLAMFNIAQCDCLRAWVGRFCVSKPRGSLESPKGTANPAIVKKSSSDTTAKRTETVDQSALSGRSVLKRVNRLSVEVLHSAFMSEACDRPLVVGKTGIYARQPAISALLSRHNRNDLRECSRIRGLLTNDGQTAPFPIREEWGQTIRNAMEQNGARRVWVLREPAWYACGRCQTRGLMRRWLNLLLLCFALSALRRAATSPSEIAITHITVIDVKAGTIKPNMTVLIQGDRITAVRPSENKESLPAKEIQVIDGRGKFLLPGFWDMHSTRTVMTAYCICFLQTGLQGFVTWRETSRKLADARRRIASGELMAPRLIFAGPMLEGPPSQADEETWIIHSPEEARHAVERLAGLHVDFIKVHDGLAREDFLAIAAASKEKGISFVGHVPASMTPAEASDFGQKSIEHFEFIPKACKVLFEFPASTTPRHVPFGCDPQSPDSLFHRFASNGTWLDPTVQSFRYFAPKQWSAIFSEFRELVPLIRQNRVLILAGTDSSSFLEDRGDPPGISLHDELALLVHAGLTQAETLRAATLNPALFLGFSDSLGSIDVGKTANLVILEANPLQDISNTKRIAAVISEGRYQMLDRMVRENCRNCPRELHTKGPAAS